MDLDFKKINNLYFLMKFIIKINVKLSILKQKIS